MNDYLFVWTIVNLNSGVFVETELFSWLYFM